MHPFVKIILFIFTLLLLSELGNKLLMLMCATLCFYALLMNHESFVRILKRMKWLFLSILIIYGVTTPGEYIQLNSSVFALTKEGCILGFMQISKVLVALATLHILFSTSSKFELMSGLHLMLSPLNYFGLKTDRFTARLLLTLDYVEEFAAKEKLNFRFDQLDNMLVSTDFSQKNCIVTLENRPFKCIDKLLIILVILSTLTLIFFRLIINRVPL